MRKIWEQMTKADTWQARHTQWLEKQERKRIANRPSAKDARFVVNRLKRGLPVPDVAVRVQRRIEANDRKQREQDAFRTLRRLGMI